VLGGSVVRRLVIAGLTALLATPACVIEPAAAEVLFSCDSVIGSGTLSPGLVRNQRAQSLSSGPTAPAGPADITLASTSDSGVKGNGSSGAGSFSAGGTKLAFTSSATNLDPADADGLPDVYVKNLATGDITLASTSDTGVKGNDQSGAPSLSSDGTRVAFESFASNFDPADATTNADVYVKDLTSGDIMLVSTSDTGVKANGSSGSGMLSADGTRVAFFSSATNLDPGDTDSIIDLYVKDLATGNITLASTSDTGVKANARSNHGPLSLLPDGTRVSFATFATNLDPGDTTADSDVYVKNVATGNITLASTSDTEVKGNGTTLYPAISADGTRLAFVSTATNFDSRDTTASVDVYVKDLASGDITLASTSDSGVKDDRYSTGPTSLSADGLTVLFASAARNFDAADTDDEEDIYVKDLVSGDITLASASDTGVDANSYVGPSSLSPDGTRVAFDSFSTNLDPADADIVWDVFVKQLPVTPTSIAIGDCSNSQSGTAAVVELRSYGARPLACPVSLGGAAGNDYPDQTPVLLGANPSLRIDWGSGPDSFGVAKLKMGTTGTQWRAVLVIQASPGHDTPATNQYLPASGSGFTKTKLKGRIDWSALDSFNCTSGTADPLSWLDLVNNGGFIVKNA
jgi:hypothetical protein